MFKLVQHVLNLVFREREASDGHGRAHSLGLPACTDLLVLKFDPPVRFGA
jgi:hypothetical protein